MEHNSTPMVDEVKENGHRISLLNLHSFYNAGDAALACLAIDQIKDNFPGCRLTLLINDPDSYTGLEKAVPSFTSWVKSQHGKQHSSWRLIQGVKLVFCSLFSAVCYRLWKKCTVIGVNPQQARLIKSYLEADITICVPGNSLYHSGRFGLAYFFSLYSLAYSVILGKPLYILPQSIGPLKYPWEKLYMRWVLNRTQLIQVREPITKQDLIRIKVRPERIKLLPDLAFLQNPIDRPHASEVLLKYGIHLPADGPLLGVSVINWQAQYQQYQKQSIYEDAIARLIQWHLAQNRGKVIFFPQVTGPSKSEDDREPARRIIALIPDELKQSVIQIVDRLNASTLKGVYGLCDGFVGTRMHANIFALGMGIPVLPIGYLHKTRGTFEMLGLDEWVVDIGTVTSESLLDRYQQFWFRKDEIKRAIQSILPEICQKAMVSGSLIAAHYKRHTESL